MAEKKQKTENMNIYKRIFAIQHEVNTVLKMNEIGTGKNSYKAVMEADILRAIKPIEEKYGVISYPVSREIIETGMVETGYVDNKRLNLWHRIKTIYRFVNVDDKDDYIETITFSDGIDTGDKGPGKAMTYGDKYALMKMYKVVTGEDVDDEESADRIKKAPKKADLIENLCNARTTLTKENIDYHSDAAQKWITSTMQLPHTKDDKLSVAEIEKLLDVYRFMYTNKLNGYKLPYEQTKLEKAVENADNQEN